MGRLLRIVEGRFGRLALNELAAGDPISAQADPVIVMQPGDADLLLLNPGENGAAAQTGRMLVLHAASDWLRSSFPAVFGEGLEVLGQAGARQRVPHRDPVRHQAGLVPLPER